MQTLPTQLAAVQQQCFKLRYQQWCPALGRQQPAKRCRWCPPGSLPGFGSERSEIRTSTTKEWCLPSQLLPCNATEQVSLTTCECCTDAWVTPLQRTVTVTKPEHTAAECSYA